MKHLWLAFLVPAGFAQACVRGWALATLWGWFLVTPFGLPALSTAQAFGVGLLVSLMTHRIEPDTAEEKAKPPNLRFAQSVSVSMFVSLLAVVLGWCAKLFL